MHAHLPEGKVATDSSGTFGNFCFCFKTNHTQITYTPWLVNIAKSQT